jgi:1,4-dihydroxy-2-naphthoyl-CoA hydrolase
MTSPIWKIDSLQTLAELNKNAEQTIHKPLGILYTSLGPNFLEGSMPVDSRTHQPMGLLHGGANVVLAESLGSLASYLVAGEGSTCVGIEISASHLRSMRSGIVVGRATPLRLGRKIHVWHIEIRDGNSSAEEPRLTSVSRLSVMVTQAKA